MPRPVPTDCARAGSVIACTAVTGRTVSTGKLNFKVLTPQKEVGEILCDLSPV